MKAIIVLSALALAAGASRPARAAHAGAPYTNVDKRNDAGNDTGDSAVDQLNAAQSDRNYYQTHPAPVPGAPTIIAPSR